MENPQFDTLYARRKVTIDPSQTDPQNVYQLLIGAIVPRPIAFVSTVSASGVHNLAPFSFFTGASSNPPVICFCTSVRPDGTFKDTLHNIRATKEFVVNVVAEEIALQMNACAGEYPPEHDEFGFSGLTAVPSEMVKPPRVLESPVSMECKLAQIVEVSVLPMGGIMIFGEVVRFHVREGISEGFKIDPDKLNAIGRMGGPTYVRTHDRFDMARPAVKI
jgi:flavin reductase (DIM6/NTAB) family NADH-FMN oxidoreductase RutF